MAARTQVMDLYSDGLIAPPVDAKALIGDLESKLTIDPQDKSQSLESLDQLALTKKDEAHKQIEEHESKFDQHEEKAKLEVHEQAQEQLHQVRAKSKGGHGPASPTVKAKSPVAALQCGPVSKDGLKARVQATMSRELLELDANYAKEKGRLDGKIDGQLESLDEEKQRQVGKVGQRMGAGQAELQTDISKRGEKHSQEIAREQKGIDAEAATQNKAITNQGASDKTRAEQEQKKQADLDKAHADLRAAEIRARATTEGTAALNNGSTRGRELTAAANARAATVPESGRAGVIEEGKQRNIIALVEGQKRQGEIQAKGQADAKAAQEQGKRAAEAMARGGKAGAPTYGEQIGASTKAGTDRVEGSAKQAGQKMAAVSAAAVGNMQVAAATAQSQSTASATGADTKMLEAQDQAKAVADKEKAAAHAKLQESYESTKTKIQAKGSAELAKIDKAKDGDLCKLEKQVSGDLKAMEQLADQADTQMAGQVKLAERKVKIAVAKQKATMRLAAQQAIAAINGFVVQAKRKIKTADKNTLKDIQSTAKVGHQTVLETGKQALADVTKNNEAIIHKITSDGAADRAAMDAHAKASEEAMAKSAAGTKGAIDEQVIKETLAVTGKNIQKKPWYDYTSDKQAGTALNALTSLPKELQGKAVEKLPEDEFKNLISEVPAKRREEFESLLENTTDPERKLQLWAAYAKSKAHNDADRMAGDQGHWYSRNKEQKENKRKNEARQNAADTTDKEVDEEVAHLRELQKNGTPLTKDAVDELYKRKKLENEIEMKYSVNITNDVDGGKLDDKSAPPTQRRVWSKSELEQLQSVVGRLPAEHRESLKVIRRSGVDQDWNTKTKQWQPGTAAAYMTGSGEMRYFDSGTSGSMRHTGAGEKDFTGNPITAIQENFPHELGHNVENSMRAKGKGDVVDRFYGAAGWENLSEADIRARMAAQGLDSTKIDAQVKALNDQRKDGVVQHYSSRKPFEGKDGKLYEIDPYGGGFLAINQDAMPDRFSGGTASQENHWGYARSNQRDHFAESYMMAVHTPKQLYQDMVGEPTKARDAVQKQLDAANDAVKAATTPEEKQLAEEQKKKAQTALDKANATVTSRGKQWGIMRNEVFNTGDVDRDAKAGLEGIATDPAKADQRKEILKQYNEEATQSATPEQINLLKEKYQAQLEALK